ncbi:PfkB family carbohydrate kinase [Bifidobacterium choloepi]|uniref:Carbohydrate kinase PfkB domain-containing protein n=1 Tax=Bifidobacterium choloepi TaxID=2614131 RepID=A0A6I5N0W9_9BIFI|nr:PfkB family carbohydrate kinase [Bifidobacterium choloepi]NEG69775.1 hypothetical protein [Bifidobacterium choloepi]
MGNRVISLGQIIVDIAMDVDHVPAPGQDEFATDHHFYVGGSYNTLQAVRQMDVDAAWGGQLGTGPMATMVREQIARSGIDHVGRIVPDEDTGFCVAMIDASAERTFVSTRGAEAHGDATAFAGIEPQAGDVVHISGYTLTHPVAAGLKAFLERTMQRDFLAVFDPGPIVADLDDATLATMIVYRPIWSLNEREVRLLADRLDVPDVAALSQRLLAPVIARIGKGGAIVAQPDGTTVAVEGFPTRAVDTNGAGDCHTGVCCAELVRGRSLVDATRLANAAASIAVTRHGPAACPTRQEAEEKITQATA